MNAVQSELKAKYQQLLRETGEFYCIACFIPIWPGEGLGFRVLVDEDGEAIAYTHIDCNEHECFVHRVFHEINMKMEEREL
jgi:hypothetical protein